MIRPFTDEDWLLFAGAEEFPNGDRPLIDDDQEDLIFIAGRDQIEVVQSDAEAAWAMPVKFFNADSAQVFLAGLPGTVEELVALGFEKIV